MKKNKRDNIGVVKNEEGFVLVAALAIFTILAIVGLNLVRITLDAVNNIKGSNNYIAARNIANSAVEAMQFDLRDHESGYNKTITCQYVEGGGMANNSSECSDPESPFSQLENIINNEGVKILMEVKGRNTEAEKISGPCTGSNFFDTECYIVPSPGTGNAGEMCKLYSPAYFPESATLPVNLANDVTDLHQVDYSCNWNKLQFGSSATDRVVIPLYYDDGVDIVNPFKTSGKIFALRMRTPCKPCVYGMDNPDNDERLCDKGADRTVCAEDERYVLDENDGNDILVQWQIMGQCDDGTGVFEEECGMVPFVKYKAGGSEDPKFSGISEFRINNSNFWFDDKIMLNSFDFYGVDTSDYSLPKIDTKLQSMEKPRLTLFLTGKLISDNGGYIPYLEYQLLTNNPVANSILEISSSVNVNGNSFDKTIYKSEGSALIDFAIQN